MSENEAKPEETEEAPTDNAASVEVVSQDNEEETTDEGKEVSEPKGGELVPVGARPLLLEPYIRQKPKWPRQGNHILAQYDNDSVVVYQAFKEEIAEYAVENQQLGGPKFNFNRMSWIKTNFLWMMYRCGWATKENQEHVLAIRITREGFDEILSNAYTAKYEKSMTDKPEVLVRLQWDPDHGPNGANERRRAIQLGLRKSMLERFANEFIVSIEDVTDMVKEQQYHATQGSIVKLMTPRERVYHVEEEEVVKRLALDKWEEEEDDDW